MAKRKDTFKSNAEDRAIDMVDALAEFEEFRDNMLPVLKKDLAAGMTAEQLIQKYHAYAAARNITMALTSENEGVSLAAIKDLMDRAGGKAKEKKEITHRLGELPEEEIDAILETKLKETILTDED